MRYLKTYNESHTEESLKDALNIELEGIKEFDCDSFKLSKLRPYHAHRHPIPVTKSDKYKIEIEEDFSSNPTIQSLLTSHDMEIDEQDEFAKSKLGKYINKVNDKLMVRFAKKYDMQILDQFVVTWMIDELAEPFSIKISMQFVLEENELKHLLSFNESTEVTNYKLRVNNSGHTLELLPDGPGYPLGGARYTQVDTYGNPTNTGDSVMLYALEIDPKYRGSGLGNIFLNKIIEHFKSKGVKNIKLDVMTNNTPAMKLYNRLGFKEEAERKKVSYHYPVRMNLQINESVNVNRKLELMYAMEIYAEELPFEMDDWSIEFMNSEQADGLNNTLKYKSLTKRHNNYTEGYLVDYKHVDLSLNHLIVIRNGSASTSWDLNKVLAKVRENADKAFGRFAKKYDMEYRFVSVDVDFNDDIDWVTAIKNGDLDRDLMTISVEFILKDRITSQNEAIEYDKIADLVKIELEDCVEFEVESIEPYSLIPKKYKLPPIQLIITEDFSSNVDVRRMIDEYLSSTIGTLQAAISNERKKVIYEIAKQINNRIFTKIARKYDIRDLDIYVSGHNWLNESYTIKVFISGKI